jgi:dolichyl-phosphate beta-glucosyltransferase
MSNLKKMISPKYSVIIPCYNEEANIRRGVLTEVEKYLKSAQYTSEVIISDDGSTDKSLFLLRDFVKKNKRFILLENVHAGKPFALRSGLLKAKGDYVLFADMDQSTPMSELEKLLPWYDKGFDFVIGSRGTSRKNFPLYRKAASFGFLVFRKLLLLRNINDTQCGFKSARKGNLIKVFSKLEVFKRKTEVKGWKVGAWDVEMLYLAEKFGFRTKEVPVAWKDEDITTTKKRNFVKESKDMLMEIFRVRINDLKGVYRN